MPKITVLAAEDTASGGGDLPIVEGGKPPSEFRLFVKGENPTTKGTLLWDEQSCADAMAWYKSTGRKRLPADWEHDSLLPAAERSPKGAPASAWWELEIRDGEPWACNIAWTADAFRQLAAGEYAHFSPVVVFDPESKRIRAIRKFALTNDPATIGQGQLVAASDPAPPVPEAAPAAAAAPLAQPPAAPAAAPTRSPAMKMNAEALQKLMQVLQGEYDNEEAMIAAIRGCLAECLPKMMEGMAAEMKQTAMAEAEKAKPAPAPAAPEPTAEEKAAMTAALSLRGKVLSLTGKTSDGEAEGVLTAWRTANERVAALTAENDTLKRGNARREIDEKITAAVTAGKLAPAERDDVTKGPGQYLAACRERGDVVALSAFLDALPAKVQGAEIPQKKTGVIVTLTAEEEAMTRAMGNDPKKVVELLQQQAAAE